MNFKRMGFPQINFNAADAIAGGNGGGFAWPADLDAPVVDLLKSKGMYDDPVKGAVGVAKSYYELNKTHSAGNMIALPAADAKAEAWEPVFAKLGRPETPDKYEVKLPTGAEMPAHDVEFARKLAHKWGVPAARFNEGVADWITYRDGQNSRFMSDAKTASDAAVAKIKTDMGEDKYTAAVGNAQKAFKIMAAQNLISPATLAALEHAVGARPVIELMAALGSRMGGEGSFLNGVTTPTPTDPSQMTSDQAKAELKKLETDKDHQEAYWNARHPNHKAAVDRAAALFAAQHKQVT